MRQGAAQRVAVQLPQARCHHLQKTTDLAREAVSCNGMFGGVPFVHVAGSRAQRLVRQLVISLYPPLLIDFDAFSMNRVRPIFHSI
jgi:hypothetical protein